MIDYPKLQSILQDLRDTLLRERCNDGYWIGQLSSSALSTAAAAFALACVDGVQHQAAFESAITWLAAHQNADGGWGDTVKSLSNVSTTALAWAAISALAPEEHSRATASAEQWLRQHIANQEAPSGGKKDAAKEAPGGSRGTLGAIVVQASSPADPDLTQSVQAGRPHHKTAERHQWSPPATEALCRGIAPASLVAAIRSRYGTDKTFAIPILSMLALAGKLDNGLTKNRAASAWRYVDQLPFELAAMPHRWLRWLALPVVSYALPALIAIGLARHVHRPSLNPIARLARRLAKAACLRKLASIQPASGGFLEAAPLTSFVVMNLAGCPALRENRDAQAVINKGVDFLLNTVREDGSWPIDTSLSNWCTSLAVAALATDEAWWTRNADECLDRFRLCEHLLAQQYRQVHPYTHADPGGWAWTNLSGAVPDADDTAAALIATARLSSEGVKEARGGSRVIVVQKPSAKKPSPCFRRGLSETHLPETQMETAVLSGLDWLTNLQNRDGGIPTFCRGWGKLPFDRSGCDLTAHALQAAAIWQRMLPLPSQYANRVAVFKRRCMSFLVKNQQADGSFLPLWFGNQYVADGHNRVYGTARVVQALLDVGEDARTVREILSRAIAYLLASQNADGSWGSASNESDAARDIVGGATPKRRLLGGVNLMTLQSSAGCRGLRSEAEQPRPADKRDCFVPLGLHKPRDPLINSSQSVSGSSSIEETALAVDALAKACMFAGEGEWLAGGVDDAALESAIDRGCEWLIARCSQIGTQPLEPSPIGLYFAQLWYFEKLYPLIFAVAALGRVASLRR